MAKKIQKVLALLMALSLCMSLLSVTALADEPEGESPKTEEPAEGTKENPKVTEKTETSEDGTVTTETITKEWTEARVDEETNESKEFQVKEITETTTVTDNTTGADIPDAPTITQPPLTNEDGTTQDVTVELGEQEDGTWAGETPVKPEIIAPETGDTSIEENEDGTTTVTTTVEDSTTTTSEDGKTTTTVTDTAERVSIVTDWVLSATMEKSDSDNSETTQASASDFAGVKGILKDAGIDIGATTEADLVAAIQKAKDAAAEGDSDLVMQLRDFLTVPAVSDMDKKPEITVSEVKFTVKEKAEDENTYKTTVSFKVEVKKDTATGKLTATVIQTVKGEKIEKSFDLDLNSAMQNGGYVVSLPGLELVEDVPVNINVGLKDSKVIGRDLSGEVKEKLVEGDSEKNTKPEKSDEGSNADFRIHTKNQLTPILEKLGVPLDGSEHDPVVLTTQDGRTFDLTYNGKHFDSGTGLSDKENLGTCVTLSYKGQKVELELETHGKGNDKDNGNGTDLYWLTNWYYYKTSYGFNGAAQTRTVDLNVALDLNFNVTEATVTTVSTSQSRVTKTTVNTTTEVPGGQQPGGQQPGGQQPGGQQPGGQQPGGQQPGGQQPGGQQPGGQQPGGQQPGGQQPGGNTPGEEIDDNDVPMTDLPDEEVPLEESPFEEIPEEEVPLASVPETGDLSVLWLALSALSGTGLAGVSLLGRKKQDEE